jgi:hypothetical protein
VFTEFKKRDAENLKEWEHSQQEIFKLENYFIKIRKENLAIREKSYARARQLEDHELDLERQLLEIYELEVETGQTSFETKQKSKKKELEESWDRMDAALDDAVAQLS